MKFKFNSLKKIKYFKVIIIFVAIFILFIFWQFFLLIKNRNVSCGGDWSYNVKCPVGTFCRPLEQGPLSGGVCRPFLFPFLFPQLDVLDKFFNPLPSSTQIPILVPIPTKDILMSSKETKTYTNSQLKFSFNYPANWAVEEKNKIENFDLCASPSTSSTRYPSNHPNYPLIYGFCGTSHEDPILFLVKKDILDIHPASWNIPRSPIHFSYFENKENLSIPEFDRYLSWFPISIGNTTTNNPNGIAAYYNGEYSCLFTPECQIYVWTDNDKIYILENYLSINKTQTKTDVFHQIFNSFKYTE